MGCTNVVCRIMIAWEVERGGERKRQEKEERENNVSYGVRGKASAVRCEACKVRVG